MIDTGKRRHHMALQEFDGALDDANQPLDHDDAHWHDVAHPWARVTPVSGREFYEAGQSDSEVTHKIDIRYRPGVRTDMRLKLGRRVFELISVIDWEERHESLLIMAKELVP